MSQWDQKCSKRVELLRRCQSCGRSEGGASSSSTSSCRAAAFSLTSIWNKETVTVKLPVSVFLHQTRRPTVSVVSSTEHHISHLTPSVLALISGTVISSCGRDLWGQSHLGRGHDLIGLFPVQVLDGCAESGWVGVRQVSQRLVASSVQLLCSWLQGKKRWCQSFSWGRGHGEAMEAQMVLT